MFRLSLWNILLILVSWILRKKVKLHEYRTLRKFLNEKSHMQISKPKASHQTKKEQLSHSSLGTPIVSYVKECLCGRSYWFMYTPQSYSLFKKWQTAMIDYTIWTISESNKYSCLKYLGFVYLSNTVIKDWTMWIK